MASGWIDTSSWQGLSASLRARIGRRVANPADRDDLVQEALLRIHRASRDLKVASSLGPWVVRIADNVVVDFWRQRGRMSEIPHVPLDEEAVADVPPPADDNRLRTALADHVARSVLRLPEPYRETLALTELAGTRYADAARSLGISLPAIKARVVRGRKMLKQALRRQCDIEFAATGQAIDCVPKAGIACATSCFPSADRPVGP
jgi:RNA polymerase sigma-70 factor (ECF subfamily)